MWIFRNIFEKKGRNGRGINDKLGIDNEKEIIKNWNKRELGDHKDSVRSMIVKGQGKDEGGK